MLFQKVFFAVLVGAAALAALYFSFRLGQALVVYGSLQGTAEAKVSQWEILEVGSRFTLKAVYSYQVKDKTCQSSFVFGEPYYLNEFSALIALREEAKRSWVVWYNPKRPENSSLEKSFPAGLLLRVVLCYGVLIYFFYLNRKSQTLDLLH